MNRSPKPDRYERAAILRAARVLLAQGWTYADMGHAVGLPKDTLYRWLNPSRADKE